jgi:nucleoporin NUP82
MKLKTFQLGPTEHMPENSPIISGLWHPLGVGGRCFVTISEDSVVRLWELNREDRSSFETSALSIDLKKLVNAEDEEANLRASYYGTGKAFTPDSVYLEPVAAAFGGLGRNGENPWSSMTLWVATTDGDVYALCPLLPSRFQAFPGLVPSISTFLDVNGKDIMEASGTSLAEEEKLRQQTLWIQDLEDQEPYLSALPLYGSQSEIFSRPAVPRPEPMLQGPFDLGIDDIEIADLLIRNVSVAEDPLEFDTGEVLLDDADDTLPLGLSILCLLTTDGIIHVVLDLDGVEPKWLPFKTPHSTPKKNAVVLASPEEDSSLSLLPLGAINLNKKQKVVPTSGVSAMITPDVRSAYAFFVTNSQGVTYVSLDSMIERLQNELIEPSEAGSDFRVDLAINANVNTEILIKFDKSQQRTHGDILACNVILEPELGYFILTSIHGHPHAVTLDTRYQDMGASVRSEALYQSQAESREISLPSTIPPRQPYEPDDRFYTRSQVPTFLRELAVKNGISLSDAVHLTPETLTMLISAHHVFGQESHHLSEAVAKLHRALNRLAHEFDDQLDKARDIARRVEGITGEDEENYADDDFVEMGRERIEARIERVSRRQQDLLSRYKTMQNKLARLSGRQPSEEEKKFKEEVEELSKNLKDGSSSNDAGTLWKRMDDINQLCNEVTVQSAEIPKTSKEASPARSERSSRNPIPSGVRKAKMDKVVRLLERESAMVDSTVERLARLSLTLQQ